MSRVTGSGHSAPFNQRMVGARIAIVCHDEAMRMQAAKAFDEAPIEWTIGLFDEAPPDADLIVRAPGIEGEGIELDLEDPSSTLKEIESRLTRRGAGKVIEVVSTGGGTGCTSLALHLAAYLSSEVPALYVESHPDRGARLRLGLDHEGPSWSDVEGADDLVSSALPIQGGFRALLAGSEDGEIPDRCVRWAQARYPFVVLDRGPAAPSSPDGAAILLMSASIPSARRAVKILEATDLSPCALIANRLGPGSEVTFEMLEGVVGRRFALTLPVSPALRDSEDEGRLLGRSSTVWSRRVGLLAEALSQP